LISPSSEFSLGFQKTTLYWFPRNIIDLLFTGFIAVFSSYPLSLNVGGSQVLDLGFFCAHFLDDFIQSDACEY
jgi:hypothetical protein